MHDTHHANATPELTFDSRLACDVTNKDAIAELVLRDGIPGVRQAVARQNEQAKAEGQHAVKAEPIVAVAERLLPALRAAEWRDRAEAAVADLAELDLRDLRSVVVAAGTPLAPASV